MIMSTVHIACYQGSTGVLNYLMQYVTDPDYSDDNYYGNSLLHYAVYGRNETRVLNMVQFLTGKCCFDKKNYIGNTALHIACEKAYKSVINYLLLSGCDPYVRNIIGQTALWSINSPEVIKEFMGFIPMEVFERILDIEELQCIELLQYMMSHHSDKWNPNHTTINGDTALHLACANDKLSVVKHLLGVNYDLSVSIRNKYGQTPLELTSSTIIIREIIKHGACPLDVLANLYLDNSQMLQIVKETNDQNLKSINSNGDTALHLASKSNRPSVVRYLLYESGVDWDVNAKNFIGQTPIQVSIDSKIIRELIKYGAKPTDLYSYCKKVLKGKMPETTVKMFIIGNCEAGKSALASTLQKEEWFWINFINYIKSFHSTNSSRPCSHIQNVKTGSGVIIHNFRSRYFGPTILYDFAGERIFHESQSDLLKETVHSPRVFIAVINLEVSESKIIDNVQYWLAEFLKDTSSTKSNTQVIVIGSKSDKLCKDEETRKVAVINDSLKDLSDELEVYEECITLDCRSSSSSHLTKLRKCLQQSYCIIKGPKTTLEFNAHCLQVYLLDTFFNVSVITIHEIMKQMEKDQLNVHDSEPLSFLPYDSAKKLLKLCIELHKKGRLLLLKDSRNIHNSWVIIDKATLITHTLSVLKSRKFQTLPSNTGVVSSSSLINLEQFNTFNYDVYIRFLIHFEFCKEVDSETFKLLTCQSVQDDLSLEHWYYFPHLVKPNAPKNIWQDESNFTYYFGWMLQCLNSEQFFTSEFLRVLLLRVLFTSSEVNCYKEQCSALERKCSVWKNGAFWGTIHGIEAFVEVALDNKTVKFFMRWREGNTLQCIEQRSQILSTIRKCTQEFCKGLRSYESFLSPSLCKKVSLDMDRMVLFDLKSITKATINLDLLAQRLNFVSSITGETLLLNELLTFEPFSVLPVSILCEISNQYSPRHVCYLSDNFIMRLAEQIGKNGTLLDMIKLFLPSDQLPPVTKDNLYIRLLKWRDTDQVTYRKLHKIFNQFSIFAELNILVSQR